MWPLLYNIECYYKDADGDRGNKELKVIIMLDVLEKQVKSNNIHFAEHKLTIKDAKNLLEQDGWIITK